LYLLDDTQVLNDMVELSGHKDHLIRAAMAWAMGYVKDTRAIPVLQELVRDRSATVRKRAAAGLVILEAILTPEAATVVVPEPQPETRAFDAPAPESSEIETELNLFLFK
jgi:HEAT repeat protein